MTRKKFKAELRAGHQENAVEVPFDPTATWGVARALSAFGQSSRHGVKLLITESARKRLSVSRQIQNRER
jgi:hypothetical protein